MLNILADKTLPLLELFQSPFFVTYYDDMDSLKKNLNTHDILLCRSTLKVQPSLLEGSSIRCIATASSGVDHIDLAYLQEKNIQLFDAKGCNAHAVADYMTSCLFWILKHRYLQQKSAAVIGMGCVGHQVSKRLKALGFTVCHYDPPRAQWDKNFHSADLEEVQKAAIICLHANLHDVEPFATRGFINERFLKKLAPHTVLINAARGGMVDENAVLNSSIMYCTDVYTNEPNIHAQIVDYATLCTPHIAGHTIEAKQNAVIALATQIYAHFNQIFPYFPPEHPLTKQKINLNPSLEKNWLAHYDPSQETDALKIASDKTQAFLALRRAHQFRHDSEI